MNNQETNQVHNSDVQEDQESNGVAMNIFAILGFIAILLAGLWATVQLVKQLSNFSFDFEKPSISIFGDNDKLALESDGKIAYSGEATSIKWTLGKEAQESAGAVTSLTYKCKKGLYLKVKVQDTDTYRVLPCNAPYSMPATQTELSVVPVLNNADAGELKYAINYTPAKSADSKLEKQTLQGSLQVAATKLAEKTPEAEKPVVQKPVVKKPTVKARTVVHKVAKAPKHYNTQYTRTVRKVVPVRTSDPSGMPDLTVKILEVMPVDTNGMVVVKFEVANIGTKLVSAWTLTATLPTEPAFTYASEPQQALYAGERAEMQLTFNKLKDGTNPLLITIDAANAIIESLETNNSVIQNIVK